MDFDENARQMHPTVPTPVEMLTFRTSPERHAAYEKLFTTVSFLGILANTALWIGV